MKFNPKTAAENILKIAEALEVEAANSSYFVCSKCNHTATLASINDRRVRVAHERNVKNVNAVTVNDKVSCPACEGVMAYAPTEESAKYYVEAAEQPLEIAPPSDTPGTEPMPSDETPMPEETPKKKTPKDPNSPFSPVDEQEGEELDLGFGDEDVDKPEEGAPEDKPPMGMGSPEETGTPPEGEGMPEDKPIGEEKPEGAPEGETPPKGDILPEGEVSEEGKEPKEEEPPVVEETVPEEGLGDMPPEPKKPGRKKKEKVEFPKEDVPKFEKMPKDASDTDYQAALNKYAF